MSPQDLASEELTRGIDPRGGLQVINTTNTENGLFGLGFGLMLRGVNAVYAMKQHDFMLLGIDQIANTSYGLHARAPAAAFTILTAVVDSGFEGPQAALNNLFEISSIARIPCITLSSAAEIEWAVRDVMLAPGVRVIGVSQRLYQTPVIAIPEAQHLPDGLFKYRTGTSITIVSFNFALEQCLALADQLQINGASADVFSVSNMTALSFEPISRSVEKTGRLVVIDNSKTELGASYRLFHSNDPAIVRSKKMHFGRPAQSRLLAPNADQFRVNDAHVRTTLGLS